MRLPVPRGQAAGWRVSGALPRFPTPSADPQEMYSSPSIAGEATPPGDQPETDPGAAGEAPGDDLTQMRDMLRREAAHAAKKAPKKKAWRLFTRCRGSLPFCPRSGAYA